MRLFFWTRRISLSSE